MRTPAALVLGLSVALGGAASADSSLPAAGAAGESGESAAEVTSLPRAGELRVAVSLGQYDGCSMSYRSELEELAVSLKLDGGRAELAASGTTRSVSGGRSSVEERPRAFRDQRGAIGGRWVGTAKIDGDALGLSLADAASRPLALTCRVERVARDGEVKGEVGALVCRSNAADGAALPVGTLASLLSALPFGRGPGYRTSESGHRFGGTPRPPHVELVRR